VLIVLSIAFYLFPRHKLLVALYLDRGMFDEAFVVVADMISDNPDDPGLLILAAEIHQRNEEPESAVAALELALAKDPQNMEALWRLTTHYEWNRSPFKAVETLEKIAAVDPDDMKALKRLWEYYRYYGPAEKEAATVVRLINLAKRLPNSAVFPDIEEDAVIFRIVRDPLYRAASREMQRLVLLRITQRRNPFVDELLRRLYAQKINYIRAITKSRAQENVVIDTALLRFFEDFVRTDMLNRAKVFAADFDQFWGQGIKGRLELVKVMRWYRLDRQALDLLAEISIQYQNESSIFIQMAKIAQENGDLAAAVAAYEQIVRLQPDNSDYKRRLAELYLESGNTPKAYNLFKKLALLPGADIDDVNRLIETAEASGRTVLLREAALLAKKLFPHNDDLLLRAAALLLGAGDEQAAMIAYVDYLKLKPEDENAQQKLAELYLWNNRPAKAYAIYKSMALTSGGDKKHVSKMIEVAGYTGRRDLIRQAALLVKKLHPRDAEFQRQAAEMLLEAGDEKAAIAAYQDYLNLKPQDQNAQQQLALLYQWNDRPQEAAELHVRLADANPKDFNKALAAGNVYIEMGDTPKGIQYLERALRIRNDDMALKKRLATYYEWVGENDKMIAMLEFLDTRSQVPDDKKLILAQAYLDRKKGIKALKYLEPYAGEAILSPEKGIMLDTAYELAGKTPAAVKILKRLAKENATDPKLLAEVGQRALGLNRTDVAFDFFSVALKKDPKNLVALKGSGQIFAWNNDPERAIARFETYNRLSPNDLEVRYQLGELYFANGREGAAFKQYKKTLTLIKKAQRLQAKTSIEQ